MQSHGDVFQFHIDLNAVHTILVQTCLGTLLQLGKHADASSGAKGSPLVKYAAQHWVDHAQFHKVSSCVQWRAKRMHVMEFKAGLMPISHFLPQKPVSILDNL